MLPIQTTSSDVACNGTFNCSSGHLDEKAVKNDPRVKWILSRETYFTIEKYIKVSTLILSVIALILNSLNISVFVSQDRNSTKYYLMAISIVDIIYAAVECFESIYIMVMANESLFSYGFRLYTSLYLKPVLLRSINCLIVLVSIERLLVVVYPLKAKDFIFMRRPKSIMVMVILAVLLFHIFSPLRFTITSTTDPTQNLTSLTVGYSQLFRQNPALMRGMSTASKVIFVYTLLIGGLILNLLVVCVLKRHSKKRQEMKTTTDADKAARRERQTTITIVTSSSVYLFLSLPLATTSILNNMIPDVFGRNKPAYYVYLLMEKLGSALMDLSMSTDFVSYLFLSTSFRTSLFSILHIKRRNVQANRRAS
ncbi:proteinase-activated receptor 1-like [Haliotis asinina]|uniref:proteinase-activated receptor 1-like n=1 Tax=Haliotis asinina TaxID=109174 RepID=UPI0035325202